MRVEGRQEILETAEITATRAGLSDLTRLSVPGLECRTDVADVRATAALLLAQLAPTVPRGYSALVGDLYRRAAALQGGACSGRVPDPQSYRPKLVVGLLLVLAGLGVGLYGARQR